MKESIRVSKAKRAANTRRLNKGHHTLAWDVQSVITLTLSSASRTLVVSLHHLTHTGEWQMVAVESTNIDKLVDAMPVTNVVDHVFVDHGHDNLGTFRGLASAMSFAEKYGKRWQRRGSIAKCKCEPIGVAS